MGFRAVFVGRGWEGDKTVAPRIRLMPDYHCWPLWRDAPESGNIDPATLGLPPGLLAALLDWAAAYDATLRPDDPAASGFASAAAEADFEAQGHALARRLRDKGGLCVRFWRD